MRKNIDYRRFAYAIITLGCALTFSAAVTPFYGSGYTLRLDILLVGLLPYTVYGLFTDAVRGWALLVAGALLLGVDLGVKVPWWFMQHDSAREDILYYTSLIMSFVVLPAILGIGARRERRWCGEPLKDSQSHGETPSA